MRYELLRYSVGYLDIVLAHSPAKPITLYGRLMNLFGKDSK